MTSLLGYYLFEKVINMLFLLIIYSRKIKRLINIYKECIVDISLRKGKNTNKPNLCHYSANPF